MLANYQTGTAVFFVIQLSFLSVSKLHNVRAAARHVNLLFAIPLLYSK